MDRIFRIARNWSNDELKKYSSLFSGHIVNVSGWKDEDKQGKTYKSYFAQATDYTITNYKAEARGFQGAENEIFLDLEKELPPELNQRFDVVFNHTVLEHVYEVRKAFANLCSMSKDVVILVVPFLQKMHSDYGDYWRFTPLCMEKLFQENGFSVAYLSFNNHFNASVYIFCIASRTDKWKDKLPYSYSWKDTEKRTKNENFIGVHAVTNPKFGDIFKYIGTYFSRVFGKMKE